MFQKENTTRTVRIFQLAEYLSRHFVDVFGSMLGLPARLADQTASPIFSTQVSGTVGFTGESVAGAIFFHCSESFARRAAAAMFGLAPDDLIGPGQVNEVVVEVANILTGGIKSWLCDTGAPCGMSTATTIRGSSFVIEPAPEVEREVLVFECGGEFVALEIHLKQV